MSDPAEPKGDGPFRRAGWKGRPPADADGPTEDAGALQRLESEPRAGSGVHELARAFQLNAEILRRIQETQRDIAKSLEQSDRSEMVIRSADALNETFRGVRSSQKALMSRIEETKAHHGRTLLIAGVVLVVIVAGLVVGVRWLVDSTKAETRQEVAGAWREDRQSRDEARATADRLRTSLEEVRRRLSDTERSRDEAAADLDRARSDAQDTRGRLEAFETLPRQLDEMRADLRVREDRILERDARIIKLDKEILELRGRHGGLTAELKTARQTLAGLQAELARREGLAGPSEAPPPVRPTVIPGDAETNPDRLQGLASALNGLLAAVSGEEHYRFEAIKGVSGQRLLGVEVTNSGYGVKLRKTIRAGSCEIVLRTEQRQVEIRFENGTVDYAGAEVAFVRNRYTVYVAGVDPAVWRRAGLTVLVEE